MKYSLEKGLDLKVSEKVKNIALIILSMPVILFILIAGICKAYDSIVLMNLENSLTNNIKAVESSKIACNSSYEALKAYKQERNLALVGNGNPCPLNSAQQ